MARPDSASRPAMRRATLALVGVALALAAAAGLVYHDLSHSNRPHELRFVPWVGALAAVSVWLSGLAALELARSTKSEGAGRWRARAGVVLACCGMLPGLAFLAFILVGIFLG